MAENQPQQKPTEAESKADAPKRVVRTFQSDMARVQGESGLGEKTGAPSSVDAPAQKPPETRGAPVPTVKKVAPQPAQKSPTPPQAPTQPRQEAKRSAETVFAPPTPQSKEERKHYVEELQATEEPFDVDRESRVPDAPQPPTQGITPPPRVPDMRVSFEEGSREKKGFFSTIVSFLLSTGKDSPATGAQPRPKSKESRVLVPTLTRREGIVPAPARTQLPSVSEVRKQQVAREEQKKEPQSLPERMPATPQKEQVREPVRTEVPQGRKAPPASASLFKAPAPKSAAPQPAPAPLPASTPVPLAPVSTSTPLPSASPLKTYAYDARDTVTKHESSRLSALAKEEDRRKAPSPTRKKSSLPALIGSGALVFGGVLAVIIAFMVTGGESETPPPPRVITPVFADTRVRVSASSVPRISHLEPLLLSVTAPREGTLTHVIFETQDTPVLSFPFSEVLMASPTVPGELSRSVYPQSMLGLYGEAKEPVMVLAVSSFERSFRSMLSWESTMDESLSVLFGPLVTDTESATSTPAFRKQFVDVVTRTYDTRILYDAEGAPHLTYGFPRDTILIITKTPETFLRLVDRLSPE